MYTRADSKRTVITLVTKEPHPPGKPGSDMPAESRILASGYNRLRVLKEAHGELRALLILERRAVLARSSGKDSSLY